MKTSAIDFLIEYVESDNENKWLQSVVSCYLKYNEKIDNEKINQLTIDLLENNSSDYSFNFVQNSSNNRDLIQLKKINHISGFNALANNQEILFNNEVTVLYGLNGSGKSSYFRILQAMMGNIQSSEIISNIYREDNQEIFVKLDYLINHTPTNIVWENNGKINELNPINIFNSETSKNFLVKRESNEQILSPYKLYVFSEVSDYIDQIKEKAKTILENRKNKNTLPNIFNKKDFLEKELEKHDRNYFLSISDNFDESKRKELHEKKKEKEKLIETNFSDKIKLLENKNKKYLKFKEVVESKLFNWISKSQEYKEQYMLYQQLEEKSRKNKEKIQILSSLPGSESNEWKEFIKSGLSISAKNKIFDKSCPFCHRTYDEDALTLVKNYSDYIQDITESKLKKCELKLKRLINEASHTKFDKESYLFESNKELQNEVLILLDKVIKYIKIITRDQNSIDEIEPIEFDTKIIRLKFDEIKNSYKEKYEKLQQEASRKKDNLAILDRRIANLEFQKSIHDEIDIIIKYIDENNTIKKIYKRVNEISSRKITSLSKAAHKDLLTTQLKDTFVEYLKEFQMDKREIKLKVRSNKGIQLTELIMKSKDNVTKILSEGEQKAVSIALFLAELAISKNKNTIILDDPVNSLDNRMIERLSSILLQLDNQIILFTHNKLLLDSILGSKNAHPCKNFNPKGCNNNKSKHVYVYKIKSEGIEEKGVAVKQINNNAKDYLHSAHQILVKNSFDDELKVGALLRNAIEHIIDEVVFNGQIPQKYSIQGVHQNIQWNKLKDMASDPQIIEDLKRIYGRLSSGGLHVGQVSNNNPLNKEELEEMHAELSILLLNK